MFFRGRSSPGGEGYVFQGKVFPLEGKAMFFRGKVFPWRGKAMFLGEDLVSAGKAYFCRQDRWSGKSHPSYIGAMILKKDRRP
jgi:hypothetical protein